MSSSLLKFDKFLRVNEWKAAPRTEGPSTHKAHRRMRTRPLATAVSLLLSVSALSAEFNSATSGLWDAANTGTWNPIGFPLTGSTDSVNILTGHVIDFSGTSSVGLPGSNDLGVASNQVININGGVLTQTPANFWIRIGHASDGTLNINDGRFHFTNNTGAANPNLQVGIRGASGTIKIGDGIGAAGSAILNLRDIVDGTANGANVTLNLAAVEGGQANGIAGTIIINSDGVLEGDKRIDGNNNPHIRIGQGSSTAQSSVIVNAGGQMRVHGNLEVGAQSGANGLLRIDGADARLDMDSGEFTVGYDGTGSLMIDNGGLFSRVDTTEARFDMFVGRRTMNGVASSGSIVVQNGGQFLRGPGGNVGDLRVGLGGTGSLTINNGGLVQNDSGNWDWVGQDAGGNGTLTINAGGIFRTTAGANMNVGVNAGATGLLVVNGGDLDLQSTSAAILRIGQNGNGTFRQVNGISVVQSVQMAENNGAAIFELLGGDFTTRGQFFLGGANNASVGTGTATATVSGGTLYVNGAFVTGLAPTHTATFNLTGGTVNHTASDITVGESGIGTMTVGASGTLNDTSGGQFLVGRNNGSNGTLIVNGLLTRTAGNEIRVGNGDTGGVDNTDAPGLLGGTGSIETLSGVRIGAKGTLTGGTATTTGTLSLTGNLAFSANGTLFVNFDGSGGVDRISLTGLADITAALLDGDWLPGGPTGINSRYWLLVNDDVDPINGTFANTSPTSPFSSLFPAADAWTNIDGQDFAIFYSADFNTNGFTGGNDLLLAAVPEPSTMVMLPAMLALGMMRRRRRA